MIELHWLNNVLLLTKVDLQLHTLLYFMNITLQAQKLTNPDLSPQQEAVNKDWKLRGVVTLSKIDN